MRGFTGALPQPGPSPNPTIYTLLLLWHFILFYFILLYFISFHFISFHFLTSLKGMLIDFLERGEGRERNIDVKEKHQSVASCMHPDWDQTRNLDMCPDRESKPQPFGLGNDAPTN